MNPKLGRLTFVFENVQCPNTLKLSAKSIPAARCRNDPPAHSVRLSAASRIVSGLASLSGFAKGAHTHTHTANPCIYPQDIPHTPAPPTPHTHIHRLFCLKGVAPPSSACLLPPRHSCCRGAAALPAPVKTPDIRECGICVCLREREQHVWTRRGAAHYLLDREDSNAEGRGRERGRGRALRHTTRRHGREVMQK